MHRRVPPPPQQRANRFQMSRHQHSSVRATNSGAIVMLTSPRAPLAARGCALPGHSRRGCALPGPACIRHAFPRALWSETLLRAEPLKAEHPELFSHFSAHKISQLGKPEMLPVPETAAWGARAASNCAPSPGGRRTSPRGWPIWGLTNPGNYLWGGNYK